MKERRFLAKPQEVRAVLDGRLSQIRRPVKPQPSGPPIYDPAMGWRFPGGPNIACPFGVPGNRLWIAETWHSESSQTLIRYRASGDDLHPLKRWKPSTNMSRSHSRILLEVGDVRVAKIQDVRPADFFLEGVPREIAGRDGDIEAASWWFMDLWGPVWDENLWTWIGEVRVVTQDGESRLAATSPPSATSSRTAGSTSCRSRA